MIHATVIGRLGADPELRHVGDQVVLKLRVAASYRPKKDQEFTTWVGCDVWGKRAEGLSRLLAKGELVCLRGVVFTREHDGKTYVDMRVDEVELLGKSGGAGAGERSNYGKSGHGASAKHTGTPEPDHGFGGEDLPF